MSAQTGALAGLRGAIDERVEADRARAFALMLQDETVMQDHLLRIKIARLDAELATVEARLVRLVRFVRAHDAQARAIADPGPSSVWTVILEELRAARDAITVEDVAPRLIAALKEE